MAAYQDPLIALAALLESGDDELTRPKPERIVCLRGDDASKVARFEEINVFVDKNGRVPRMCDELYERSLAVSLEKSFRPNQTARDMLSGYDRHNLLNQTEAPKGRPVPQTIEELMLVDDPLLDADPAGLFTPLADVPAGLDAGDITRVTPDRIAETRKCLTFDVWRPVFNGLRHDVNTGRRIVQAVRGHRNITRGNAYIVKGRIAVVAEVNNVSNGVGGTHERLRIVYDNGTESDHLLESFRKVIIADLEARSISHPDGSVGGDLYKAPDDALRVDIEGRIYVAATLSDDPALAIWKPIILKIGRTGQAVAKRIAHATREAAYFHAPVRILRSYALIKHEPARVEAALHAFFAHVAFNATITDASGRKAEPREWFEVPLQIVDEAMKLYDSQEIYRYAYDETAGRIIEKA